MKVGCLLLAIAVGVFAVGTGMAQAPVGSTGQCRDGSFTSAASRSGACRGHKGVQKWFEDAAPATQVTPATGKTAASVAPREAAEKAMQPGAGPEMVWVNTATKVYHCPGTKFYGKTKEGKYITEVEAKASGARPDHGKPCSK